MQLFKLFVRQGDLKDSKEINGDSILHLIVEKENDFSQSAIELLGNSQFDFDVQNQKGQTALFNSLKRKHVKNSLLLLKFTQNFQYQNPKNGFSYLHLAVYLNNLQLIWLIGKRSEKALNLKNKKNLTALEMAQDEAKVVLLALEEQFVMQKNNFIKAPSLDDLQKPQINKKLDWSNSQKANTEMAEQVQSQKEIKDDEILQLES